MTVRGRASIPIASAAWWGCSVLPACAETPLSYLTAFGAKAEGILPLTWGLTIISILVVVIVTALLVWGLLRAPRIEPDDAMRMPVERPKGGLAWVYVGVGVSTLVLFGSAIWTMVTLAAVGQPPEKPALTIEVTGHQWWWQVDYLDDDPSQTFTTANEIHVPVGKPVAVKLRAADVIHSFWVPALTGKTDLIPGQTNVTWMRAGKAGVYRGQCTEFCGAQHAHMGLVVIADAPDAFEAWRQQQIEGAAATKSDATKAGAIAFIAHCGACHRVSGTPAGGIMGPDLSHLMQRRTIAAGTLPNNPGTLAGWIADPQAIKPGNLMPRTDVTPQELQEIVAYLQTLK